MMDAANCNGLRNTWLLLARSHRGVVVSLFAPSRVLGNGLSVGIPLMAGISPVCILFDVVLREFRPPLDPVTCLVLAGIVACFIYLPFCLTCAPERSLSMITALIICFGLVAGFIAVWFST
jgi:hypothetical protein